MSSDPALQAYLAEAASWDADCRAQRERSLKIAWRVATCSTVLLTLSLVTLALLMPLKRVEPFVVRVDNSTGIVDVVPVYAGKAPMPEAVTRYFLEHYVTVCERFNFSTAESDYEECGAFHGAARNQAWYAAWDRANPASPNPLGFKVVDFHAEPEVLPVEPVPRGTAGESAGTRPTESTG